MTTLNVNGQHVTVDDSFLSLSPEEQHSTVEEIAAHLGPPDRFDRQDPRFSPGAMASGAALEGVPILGASVQKAGAYISALAHPLTGVGADGDSISERAAKNLEQEDSASAAYKREHPIELTAAHLVGGALATVPMVAAAPAAMGAAGSLGARMLMGGGTNAAIGAADAGARGQDPVTGGLIAGLLGVGGPLAEKAVSPIVSNLAARINPQGFATRQVARGIAESGRTTDQLANDVTTAATEGQPQFTLADAMGNPGQRMLSTVARAPGEGRTDVVNALENRQAGQGRRVANTLSEGFGSRMTPDQMREAMTADRGAIADQEYGAVRNDAQPVDVSNVIDHIEANTPAAPATPDTISGRLQRYRSMLTDGEDNLSDFAHVQRVRSELSDEIQSSHQSGQRDRARMLGQVLTRLDTSLENSSQGFRQANANFRQASRNIDAIDAGRTAATRGRTEDTIPAFNDLTPRGQQAFRAGYVDPLIADAQKAAPGVNKARPLLNDALQDEAAAMAPGNDLMQRRIGREQTMFETRAQALGGSKTMDNLNDHAALGINPSVVMHAATGNWGAAIGGMLHAGVRGMTGNTPAVRKAVADILLRHGGNMTPAQLNQMVGRTISQIQFLQTMARSGVGAAATTTNANQKPPIFVTR